MIRNLPNNELIRLCDSELVLRFHNPKKLRDTRNMLARFMDYLGAYAPSPELAKSYLAQYVEKQPATLHHYAKISLGGAAFWQINLVTCV
jgi:hypothetical protein